jgi:hypothetical protein
MRDLTTREFLEKSLKTGSAFGIGVSAFKVSSRRKDDAGD